MFPPRTSPTTEIDERPGKNALTPFSMKSITLKSYFLIATSKLTLRSCIHKFHTVFTLTRTILCVGKVATCNMHVFRCVLVLTSVFLLQHGLADAEPVWRKDVQKRFVLMLGEDASDEAVGQNVSTLLFKDKSAQCKVLRLHEAMRMMNVQCGAVQSEKQALLINALLKEIPGVERSTPDAILSSSPTNSRVKDDNEGKGSSAPMFLPVSRVQMPKGGAMAPYNWGLDRIDEEYSPLDNVPIDFSCYPKQGAGVRVFVIDTGCKVEHVEFSKAIISTMPAPGSDFSNGVDDHGHGTHIAGVIAGKNVGIARDADVKCIKAFDKNGNGAATDTISAVEYIIEEKKKDTSVPFVVNLSYSALTGFSTTALDDIVYATSAHGIIFVVSAGNAAVNSCLFSPSKAEQALTVTASTKRDTLETDSNIGPCVEFIAPGHEIVSAGIDSLDDYESLNGTSMATPHVAGLATLILAENLDFQQNLPTVRDRLYEMMVTTRSSSVAEFVMPLMETGCGDPMASPSIEASDEPLISPDTQVPEFEEMLMPERSQTVEFPTASVEPQATTTPSPRKLNSFGPSTLSRPEHGVGSEAYWRRKRVRNMKHDLGFTAAKRSSKPMKRYHY